MKWIIFFYAITHPTIKDKPLEYIVINQYTVYAFETEWYITPSKYPMKMDTYKDKIYRGFFYLKSGKHRATLLIDGRSAVFTLLGDREQTINYQINQLPHYNEYYRRIGI